MWHGGPSRSLWRRQGKLPPSGPSPFPCGGAAKVAVVLPMPVGSWRPQPGEGEWLGQQVPRLLGLPDGHSCSGTGE